MTRVLEFVSIRRAVLGILTVWMAVVVAGNVIDASVALGVLPPDAPFASGNFHQIVTQLAKFDLPVALEGVFFGLAIVLEAAIAAVLVRTLVETNARLEDLAFALSIVLFGGFVIVDELSGAFQTEAVHRNLVVFVGVLYLVVRADRSLRFDASLRGK